jgi:crotonobetainyl-CoA:carnitine CoA-transferase CaiB-like acyl-CoA transferase
VHVGALNRLATKLAPSLGADTRSILGELGYSEPEIESLAQERVI